MPEIQYNPTIKVRFEPLPHDPKSKWPLIQVQLSFGKLIIPQDIITLVDSGANISIIHSDIAAALGFPKNKLKFNKGGKSVSGDYVSAVIPDKITVKIYGYEFGLNFTVIDNPVLLFPCILGENSIFQWARLDFQKFKGFFEIKFRRDIY